MDEATFSESITTPNNQITGETKMEMQHHRRHILRRSSKPFMLLYYILHRKTINANI